MVEEKTFPYKIEDMEPEDTKKLLEYCKGGDGFVRVGPKGYFFAQRYKEGGAKIYNMPLRPSDVFVASFPRSGTTWTQELVWMVANDLDYKKANSIPLTKRFPFLDRFAARQEIFIEENRHSKEKLEHIELYHQSGTDRLAETPSPRFIKTHMPLSLLPPTLLNTAKVVYVARDPRDVAVSYYHFSRLLRTVDYTGDFKTFWHFFINDLWHRTPYFEHVKEFWEKRDHPNMLFLFYEELSKDMKASIHRVMKFLGKEFSAEDVEGLCNHLSIDNFKNNKSVNFDDVKELGLLKSDEQPFVRKGKAGGWRDYFDEEMTLQAERWIADNLRDTDLRFPHVDD